MDTTSLVQRITGQVQSLERGIVHHDPEAIEEAAAQAKALLVEFGQQMEATHQPPGAAALNEMRSGALRCSAVLRRAQLTVQALQNVHDLFSPHETYQVRS